MTPPVLAATAWSSNAAMILDVVKLRYLTDEDFLLDPTYGRGRWWTKWREPNVTHDITLDGVDFRDLPDADGIFDSVAFDPPYVAMGGRKTTGIQEFFERYGLTDAPKRPAELQAMNDAGLRECLRVVRKRGIVICKVQDYVTSGHLYPGTHLTLTAALAMGFKLEDRLEHLGKARMQPARTRKDGKPVRQHHARRNLSTLLVLRA